MIRWKFKNWDRASPIGPGISEVYAGSCFLDDVASPVSIKARSRLSLDQLLNSTSHMLCIWGTVNRRNLQYLRVGSAVFCTGRPPSLRARSVGKRLPCGTPWVPICRVIRFILARLIIDSNRWLLISYKQWLFHERSSLVISLKLKDTDGKDGRWWILLKKEEKDIALILMIPLLILIWYDSSDQDDNILLIT